MIISSISDQYIHIFQSFLKNVMCPNSTWNPNNFSLEKADRQFYNVVAREGTSEADKQFVMGAVAGIRHFGG